MPVLEFPGALATAAPASAAKAADPILCTVLSRLLRAGHSHQHSYQSSCHCSRGAGRSVCWIDTTPCTAELRCERSRTVRTGHKRHTNALKSRFGYFTATVKEGESSILSNNLLDSECLVYFTQHASPNMCSSQPRET